MTRGITLPVGTRHGRLAVTFPRLPGEKRVQCRCDCGAERSVPFTEWGKSQSCGCLSREMSAARLRTHGRYRTPEYNTWAGIIRRCTNPDDPRWPDYGGRGITVCERWRDFANFFADVGERPAGLTFDRIDNDRGYEPGNWRWANFSTQMKNRRRPDLNRTRDAAGRYMKESGS